MKALAFFDTNILVYSNDTADARRQARAIALLAAYRRDNSLVVSVLVLQEYYATATRGLHVDPILVQARVEALARGRVVRFTERDVIAGHRTPSPERDPDFLLGCDDRARRTPGECVCFIQ